jgi:capsular exopolysaccharide synthesis family protein
VISSIKNVPVPRTLAALSHDGLVALSAFGAAIRKYWPTVVACAIFGAGAALLFSRALRKVYDAASLVELNAIVARPLGDKADDVMSASVAWWDSSEYYETQYRIVTSQRVLTAVARNFNLPSDLDFLGLKAPPAKPVSLDDAAAILRGHVRVEAIKNSRLFSLHVEDTDPARARALCSAIANTYIEQNLEAAINGSSDAVVWLSGQLDHVKQQLESDENSLQSFKEEHDLPSTTINEASNMVRLEMQEYDTALTRIRTKKEELQARYTELSKVSDDNPDQLPDSELLSSPFLQSLRSQYQEALKEQNTLLAEGKGENHPLVKRAAEKIATTRRALLAEVRNIQGAVERDLAIATREEAGGEGLFENARKRAVEINLQEIGYRRLDRAREQNEKLYAMLLQRMKEADLARMMRVNNIRLVDDALEPKVPVRPRTMLNVGLGLMLGLLLGVAVSWLRVRLDVSIKTPADLESELGLTFLGLIPEVDGSDEVRYGRRGQRRRRATKDSEGGPSELVVHQRPLSGVAEAARAVRTNLMFMSPDRPYRKLLVTSAAPSEGKTTIACSIAIALAQGGQRVCIVDCDLRRPRLHRIFNRAGDAGVTNVLVGDATLEDVIQPTQIKNLWSVPAGPTPPNPADVLHSERFRALLEKLSDRFDRVIIDSPPLIAVTDSAIISRLADGTVFVVRAFRTSKHVSAQGLRVLRDVDAHVVGAVLNAVNLNRHEYTYYYHYYYYKREGYRSPTTGPDEQPASGSALPPPN